VSAFLVEYSLSTRHGSIGELPSIHTPPSVSYKEFSRVEEAFIWIRLNERNINTYKIFETNKFSSDRPATGLCFVGYNTPNIYVLLPQSMSYREFPCVTEAFAWIKCNAQRIRNPKILEAKEFTIELPEAVRRRLPSPPQVPDDDF